MAEPGASRRGEGARVVVAEIDGLAAEATAASLRAEGSAELAGVTDALTFHARRAAP